MLFEETVNSDIYCSVISQYITLLDLVEYYYTFQRDEPKLYTSNATTEYFKPIFEDQLTCTGLLLMRGPDLTFPDFLLWETLQNKVSKSTPENITQLIQIIIMEIQPITWVTLKKVEESTLMRCL